MLKNFDLLPIDNHKAEIIDAINNNQVVVIAGDTGSGKTTRIPQFCLELDRENSKKLIGCTQPRRLAAVSVSERVASELGDNRLVNYKIRFHDKTTSDTLIKFMTDGVLLAETKNDPLLKGYNVLIIDEAHERNRNIDFLLGYLKRLLDKRVDLKLIITSATIDTTTFAKHFNNAPVISIEGRTYPVEVRYNPIDEGDEDYLDFCVKSVEALFKTDIPADTLVFLPTEKDIRSCCEVLSKRLDNVEVLPLFGRLQSSDQQRIFRRSNKTKVVVATNIAETSITVPGIRYVVDSGLARMTYYNTRSKTTSLPIQKISQASCNQRKGRCGRVGPGICIRLFAEEDYLNREEYTLPEIKRSNLAEVLLQMASLRLGDPLKFPFINPPNSSSIRDGYTILRELGAIDTNYKLTKRGRLMSELPIDPCISRILIEASHNNCLKEIKIIASVLAIQDPRIRPADKEKEADTAHSKFSHKHSDFMVLLNIWNSFHNSDESTSWSRLKKFCKSNYLSFQRMREWFDLHEQLSRILSRNKQFDDNEQEASYEQIHRSLLSGFLRNIALKQEKKLYQGAGNKELMVFPGSYQFQTSGQWVVAADFLETNRLYALTVATIEPEWIEPLAKPLCKYNWSNPRWEKRSGQIVADEKVTLFGLVIVASRKINFGKRHKKNITEARNIFIESALLTGEISGNYSFLSHNLKLIKKWKKTEDRLRKRNILQSDLVLHQFYEERLKDEIYDRTTLNKYLKNKSDKALFMKESDILLRTPESSEYADFPQKITINGVQLRVSYKFNPAGSRDGLTIHLPLSFAETFSQNQFEWLVPGFLHEKLTLLLKGLPKSLRKRLVPINLAVDKILDDVSQDFGKGSFLGRVETSILKLYRFQIQRADWTKSLPAHLIPNFVLLDEVGKNVAQGNNLATMLQKTEPKTADHKNKSKPSEKDERLIKKLNSLETDKWSFDNVPSSIPLYLTDKNVVGFLYPYLVEVKQKNLVSIKFTQNKKEALNLNKIGLLFLYRLQFTATIKSLKKACANTLSAPSSLNFVKHYENKNEAANELLNSILMLIFSVSKANSIPTKEEFTSKVETVKKEGIYKIGSKICDKLGDTLRLRTILLKSISALPEKQPNNLKTSSDFTVILDDLFPSNYLSIGQIELIDDLYRQLKCLEVRLERFSHNPLKDLQKEAPILPHMKNVADLKNKVLQPDTLDLLAEYKLLIDEFKIAQFAPELKTKVSVSEKKLNEKWQELKGFI